MNRFHFPCAALLGLCSTLACGQALTSVAMPRELSTASSEQLRAAYLECDRVTATASVAPEYMSACAEIGSALMHRDFGGDFQRQIDWWRSVRGPARLAQDSLPPAGHQP